jgi:hypothetical protein
MYVVPIESQLPSQSIIMKEKNMYFDMLRAKIYRDNYRPSPNIFRFLGNLLTILLEGQSPLNNSHSFPVKRKK